MGHHSTPDHRSASGLGRRARGFAVGPLLLIILGAAALLLWRFVPWDTLLDRTAEQPEQPVSSPPILVGVPEESPPPVAGEESILVEPPEIAAVAEPAPPMAEPSGETAVAPPVIEPPMVQPPPVVAVLPSAPAVAPKPPPVAAVPPAVTSKPPSAPAVAPKPPVAPRPAPTSPPTEEKTALAARVTPPEPAAIVPVKPKPNLIVLVEAEVDDRAGLGAYTGEQYAALLKEELEAVAVATLGGEMVSRGTANLSFRDRMDDGREGMTALCEQAGAQRLLLADLRIPSAGFSTIDSAYWPEVSFIVLNCTDGRSHRRPKKRLEPNYRDRFEFQYQFTENAQAFVASQGYFLRP